MAIAVLYRIREVFHGRTTQLGYAVRAFLYRLIYPIGHNVNIAAACRLEGKGIQIGNNSMLDYGVTLIGPVSLGSGCYINQGCIITRSVTINDNVAMGSNCVIFGESRVPSDDPECRIGDPSTSNQMPGTIIENGVMFGANVTVVHGIRIGKGCVIAAGAVVTRDCEPNGVYAGVPAKRIKDL